MTWRQVGWVFLACGFFLSLIGSWACVPMLVAGLYFIFDGDRYDR